MSAKADLLTLVVGAGESPDVDATVIMMGVSRCRVTIPLLTPTHSAEPHHDLAGDAPRLLTGWARRHEYLA
jgi:hypothetical protein